MDLSRATLRPVTVTVRSANGTATAPADYPALTRAVYFTPGTTQRPLTVTVHNDTLVEGPEYFELQLTDPHNATLSTDSTTTINIADDDLPTVTLQTDVYTTTETAGVLVMKAQLSDRYAATAAVEYYSHAGTAAAGTDYESINGTLVFPPGTRTHTFMLPLLDDEIPETAETLVVQLRNPSQCHLGTPVSATITLYSDDPYYVHLPLVLRNYVAPRVSFSAAHYSVDEGSGVFTAHVVLNRDFLHAISVDYSTSNGTALAGLDYAASSGTLFFPAGQVTQTFPIMITDDRSDEANETVLLTLHTVTDASLFEPYTATLTIRDNDPQPTVSLNATAYTVNEDESQLDFYVNLSHPSSFLVSVKYATTDDSATADEDYAPLAGTLVFTPGTEAQLLSVTLLNDDKDEPDETFNIQLQDPLSATLGTAMAEVLINDDDQPVVSFGQAVYNVSETTAKVSIQVQLNRPSWQEIWVTYRTQNDSATASTDYVAMDGTLHFAPGTTSQRFEITILDDALDEDANERLTLRLSEPQNANLGTPNPATVVIADDDPQPRVQFEVAEQHVPETQNRLPLTVQLDTPSGRSVTVDYTTVAGTAVASGDYVATQGTLTFLAGQTSKIIDVIIVDDKMYESSSETFAVQLSNPLNLELGERVVQTITIEDDDYRADLVGALTLSPPQASYAAGEPVTVTIVVTNVGVAPAAPFWVDFYINPSQIPDQSNQAWSDYCSLDPCYGIAWEVKIVLEPGQSIELVSVDGSYANGYTRWLGYFAPGTTAVYVYLDTWSPGAAEGAVHELYENNNLITLQGLGSHSNAPGAGACPDAGCPALLLPPRPAPAPLEDKGVK